MWSRGLVSGLLGVGLLLASATGCGDGGTTPGPAPEFTEPGTSFEVDVGERFTVTLESNATTGYAWELSEEPEREVVRLVDDVFIAPDTDLVGAPGRQEFVFEAVGDGSTVVRLWYVRSFDDPPQPADRAEFGVVVGRGDGTGGAIDVAELVESEPTGEVVVRGMLFDDGDGLVLCGVLAESYPPQCVGASVTIDDPDVVDAEFTVEGDVRWTDSVVTLTGVLTDGGFQVDAR